VYADGTYKRVSIGVKGIACELCEYGMNLQQSLMGLIDCSRCVQIFFELSDFNRYILLIDCGVNDGSKISYAGISFQAFGSYQQRPHGRTGMANTLCLLNRYSIHERPHSK
jgi:hypothetical protein